MRKAVDEWLALLEARHPKTIDLGLDRCRSVWKRMGEPKPAPIIIIVAGTNGKGSTVATICSLLGGLGYRHGSYTSPHLFDYNERVRVNGQVFADQDFVHAFERVEVALGDVSLSYFEFGTLAAFSMLAREELDFAVLEVGLGGRLDAVNLLDADCAVITPVGLDHQEYLGDDLESIGWEKAGIIRPGRPVVCGERNPPASIVRQAHAQGAQLRRLGEEFRVDRGPEHMHFRMGDVDLNLSLPALAGVHQLENTATALAAVLQLVPAAAGALAALDRGLNSVELPGRLQRVLEHPTIWLDVGHNPLSAQAVARTIADIMLVEGIRKCRCVLAMLGDKDAAAVATALDPVISEWYCAGLQGERGQSGKQLADRINAAGTVQRTAVFDTVRLALDAAISDSGEEDALLVFGSFLTAAEAAKTIANNASTTQTR